MTDENSAGSIPARDEAEDVFSTDELDRLYQQAIEAMDALEWEGDLAGGLESPAGEGDDPDDLTPSPNGYLKLHDASEEPADSPAEESNLTADAKLQLPGEAAGSQSESSSELRRSRTTPRQIVEAALFVGGMPLTARKLAGLLRGDYTPEFVESAIQDLNTQYASEGRPYEIQFGEGGYRLALREDFDRVRNRVFGLGPKEVKLSQEALEVLALVAYQQPISRETIEKTGKQNAGSTLRQLLRRELITIERDGAGGKGNEVNYRTSPRFLQVFGLGDLDELPQAEELDLK